MANYPMDDREFDDLLARIRQETSHVAKKLEILYASRGGFNGLQAARILEAIAISPHKVAACRMMEPRLCPMSCDESRLVLSCVSFHNDKVAVLNNLKRVLCDCHTNLGKEYVLSSYPYETDKYRALRILQTIQSDTTQKTPAGDHQGFAPLGSLYTQSRRVAAGHGQNALPPGRAPGADPGILPSRYTSHPSYSCPRDKTYLETRNYPGPTVLMDQDEPGCKSYPTGAPPVGYDQRSPAQVGFPGL